MKLIKAQYIDPETSRQIFDFRGYNALNNIADGEMRDMKNLSSDGFPFLTQRKKRSIHSSAYNNPSNLTSSKEKLIVVDEGKFYYDGVQRGTLTAGEKQIATINAKIVIFPDKKYYDTVSNEFGSLEATQSIVTTGTVYLTVTANTITITGGSFSGFKAGDAVKISGMTARPVNNIEAILVNATSTVLTFGEDSFSLADGTTSYKETGTIIITRSCPDLDYVIEYNNRLWGCKGNAIYSSKLGDPLNWNYFNGLSQDSYAVEVGSDGDFTGCASCGTHLVFFKEDFIHKLYGDKPSNYQISTIKCQGLQSGSEKSICYADGILYYKGRNGIMAYNSGTPELISEKLGDTKYSKAVAGTDGLKYYVSLKENVDKYTLFVLDLRKGLWHKEDNTNVQQFAYSDGLLYYINAKTGDIIVIDDNGSEIIEWMAQLGEFNEYSENKKIYSKIKLRFDIGDSSTLDIFISYDGGEYRPIKTIYSEHRKTAYIPITPIRCDRFSIKLVGRGKCKIESIVREFRVGSEV